MLQEEVDMVIKGQHHQGSCGDGGLLYLECSGGQYSPI